MYVGSTVYLVTRYTNPTVVITMWWFCFRSNAGQYLSLYDNVMPAGLELWQFLCCNIQLWIWPIIWWGHPIQVWHQRRVQSTTFCFKIGIFFSTWEQLVWDFSVIIAGNTQSGTCEGPVRSHWAGTARDEHPDEPKLSFSFLLTTQQTFGSHIFNKRVSQKPKQTSICPNIKAGWTARSHMKNAPSTHIPCTHTILQHSGCISLLWVFHPGWIEHTCATCECQLDAVEALWQDFPQSASSSTMVISSQRQCCAPAPPSHFSPNKQPSRYFHQWRATAHLSYVHRTRSVILETRWIGISVQSLHRWYTKHTCMLMFHLLLVFQLCGK